MSIPSSQSNRIVSLDQFRGYTVAGMFLVNFLGGFDNWPTVLKHHNVYCSYADTIMPHFLFAVGFAFRLTFGRRIQTAGAFAAYRRVVTRFLGLALVAFAVYHVGRVAGSWQELKELGAWGAIATPLKRQWFQTLMHIAVTALWITPVIRSSKGVRIAYMLGSVGLHIALSQWFNFAWCSTNSNVIDGGPIGVLTWTVPAILGTLVCDAVADAQGRPNLVKMFAWSILIMALGWGLSCGTRLYDLSPSRLADLQNQMKEQAAEKGKVSGPLGQKRAAHKATMVKVQELTKKIEGTEFEAAAVGAEKAQFQAEKEQLEKEDQEVLAEITKLEAELRQFRELKLAADPIFPSAERIERKKQEFKEQGWRALVAEPPFVAPPHEAKPKEQRPMMLREWNYWMISQRHGTLSYLTFCGGLSIAVYALFYIACDIWGLQLGIFRTLGTNALAGYVLHDMIGGAVKAFMPRDCPTWYMTAGFLFFFWLVWLFVRSLEKNKIYIKL